MSRLVKLDPLLLALAVDAERDSLTAEMASREDFAYRAFSGPAFACLDGGELVGAGGLVPHWHGRAEGWWLTGQCARPRQLVNASRLARDFLDRRQRDPAFRRIEIYVRAQERWADSFAHALGFKRGRLLHAWDPVARSYWMFERIAGMP